LVANLLAQLAFGLLAMTICLPSMQEWAGIFGASQASVQLTFSGYVIAYGGLQLLYGPLSDRLGRKNILLFGLFVAGVGSVLAALAPNLGLLTLARVLQGAGSAAGMVVGRAMVQDLFQGPARTRVMAYIGMTMGLCPPLATIIGGQLHVRLGWQSNFVLIAVLAAVLFVAAWRGLPDHQKTTTVQPHWLRAMWASYARLAREPAFILYVALLSMITATFYTFLSGAPIVLGSYGVGPEGIGYYIMSIPLAYIVGNYLTSHLVHRTGERPMMRLGQALTLSGVALMLGLALAGWHSPLAFALPLILLGIGHGFLVPPALAGTVSLVPALAGSAAAVAGLMQQMMGAVGGFTAGLFPHESAVNLGLLMLGYALCAALAHWLLHRRPS
jgi:DHA1 family bicyclomycin/chloramphenicol resistance-like MFS transporter